MVRRHRRPSNPGDLRARWKLVVFKAEASDVRETLPNLDEAEFDRHMRSQVQMAQACAGQDEIIPQFTIVHTSGTDLFSKATALYACAVNFNEDHEKLAMVEWIANDLAKQKQIPLAAFLLSEAWQAMMRKGDPHIEPRHAPDRIEVVVLCGLYITAEKRLVAKFSRGPLQRDPSGKIRKFDMCAPIADGTKFCLGEKLFAAFFEAVMSGVHRE